MTFLPPPPGHSGLMLLALPVAVFDTETTGLNTVQDRVIEIGAVRISAGQVDEGGNFSMLVDPGVPIPGASTEIHGIKDTDVDGAPGFASVMGAFSEWAGPSVMVGYSVAFDVSVLKAEHERHGLGWKPPRTLDVRDLAQVLAPDLPDLSLETLAVWLGLGVEGRHRALTDALITARIFLALLPRLRDRGVRTLAEAERVCSARQGLPGAQRPTSPPSTPEYARIDSFPYRHRVGAVMSPAMAVAPYLHLSEALAQMAEARVSALFVSAEGHRDTGILTERDVLQAIHAGGAAALDRRIDGICSRPLLTVGREELLYRALITMSSGRIRHLGVVDANGALVGVLSARSLLRQRAADAVSLGQEIETAKDPAELGRIWSELTTVVRSLAEERVDARDVASVISRELRALTRRACQIAETELADDGLIPPTESWAMLVLGSGGRGESLLAMDQDNAIVFREGGAGGAADIWCERLGRKVSDILDSAGVRYCDGGVMAFNPDWRRDLAGWRETVTTWISRTRPEDILSADIFFDAMPVHGDLELADSLRRDALQAAKGAVPFLRLLARRAAEYDSPLGMFGRFRLERGRIDLKKGGILPLFSAARVIALRHGLAERSTLERLRAAAELENASRTTLDDLVTAHEILLGLVLQQQLRDLEQGIPLSNRVAPGELDGHRRQEMKWALSRIPAIADIVGVPPSI